MLQLLLGTELDVLVIKNRFVLCKTLHKRIPYHIKLEIKIKQKHLFFIFYRQCFDNLQIILSLVVTRY